MTWSLMVHGVAVAPTIEQSMGMKHENWLLIINMSSKYVMNSPLWQKLCDIRTIFHLCYFVSTQILSILYIIIVVIITI